MPPRYPAAVNRTPATSDAIKTVIGVLGPIERFDDEESWSTVLTGAKGMPDGKYFAIDREVERKCAARTGHAFVVIEKELGMGMFGNNAEVTDQPQDAVIEKRQQHLVGCICPTRGKRGGA